MQAPDDYRMPKDLESFRDFWPHYLYEHRNRTNRLIHVCGTVLTIPIWVSAFVYWDFSILLWLPVVGYGFAWFGHFFIEKNRPATFKYPLYSLIGDHVMTSFFFTGRLDAEMEKAIEVINAGDFSVKK